MPPFTKGEIPFLLLLMPFVAGLGLAAILPLAMYYTYLLYAFYCLLTVFVALNLFYQRLSLYKIQWAGGMIMYLLLLLAGAISFESHREINTASHFSKQPSAYLIVRINKEPKFSGDILRFMAKAESAYSNKQFKPVTGSLIVSVRADRTQKAGFNYGDELLIPAKYTAVEPPLNYAEFNYKAYLAHQNIYHQSFLSVNQLVVLRKGQGNKIITFALNSRKRLADKLKSNIRDTDAVAVVSTIILGYRADLRKEVQEAYSKTGTMHLLSVSGMHVALVYLLLSFGLDFLLRYKHGKLIKAILSVLLIWCYALITGFSPAVCRASLMIGMVIIGFSFNRHISRLNVLAVSAFILLLYNPFLITDAGFQLSYLAVFGIIILQPLIYRLLTFKNKWVAKLWMVCSVSIAAQIALFPVSVFYFHDFPVYFLASNLFVVIPSAMVMYLGILYLFLPQIPIVSPALGWCLEKTTLLMTKVLSAIEHAPIGSINKIWLTTFEQVMLYGLIISVVYAFAKKSKTGLKLSFGFAVLFAASISIKRYTALNTQTITFFNLRKKPGLLFKNGSQAVFVSDLNAADKSYQYSVQPYLDSCKINHLQSINWGADVSKGYLIKYGGLIWFDNNKILVVNKSFNTAPYANKINVDYIYICGSPAISLHDLTEHFNFKTVIIDAGISEFVANKLEQEALASKIDCKNLKRNKSIVIPSNQHI